MKKSNFITIKHHHINTDHIVNFRLENNKLSLFIGSNGVHFCFDDPLGEKYRKVCAAVGVDPVDAHKSANMNVAVYAELGEKRQLVQLCSDINCAVFLCQAHNWKAKDLRLLPEDDPIRKGVLKIELWKSGEPAKMEVASK